MFYKNTIRLFWWNEIKLMHKSKENYGDLLGKYLVEKISKKKVVWVFPKHFSIFNYFKPVYVTVGSILSHVNEKSIVWGSGIIQSDQMVKNAKFLAVRGPQTRKRIIEQGYEVPEVFGDPALLLPIFYSPSIEKKYKIGIIPHYNDFKFIRDLYHFDKSIKVIDLMTLDIESTTAEILECEKIISSSLHGIIVSHTYGIPAVWQKFSDKVFGDDVKYQDYFESVKIEYYTPLIKEDCYTNEELDILFVKYPSTLNSEILESLRNGLMKVCPF